MLKIQKEKISTWFVTGASSGFGHNLSLKLLERGYNVVCISRTIPNIVHDNCLCLSCDVTNIESVKKTIGLALERFKRIDVLSNNAGISASIMLEDENLEHMKEVMNTNFFGSFNTMNLLIPHFRNNKNGTIINNTSQSGISHRAMGSAYVSSKHALEGLTSVCWYETHKFCRVMALELGYFKGTGILKEAKKQLPKFEEYRIPSFYRPFKRNFNNNLDIAVNKLINVVEQRDLPRRLMLGKDAMFQIGAEIEDLKRDYLRCYKDSLECSIEVAE